MKSPVGCYVHFPWCVRKCPYCDFNSHPLRGDLDASGYLAALQADFAGEAERFGNRPVDTVYFGGGTPSLFPPEVFKKLLGLMPEAVEITMEANPGAVEHGDFHGYREAGVTRISLGAQSFDASQLAGLGRIHGRADTAAAVDRVKDAGFTSFNIDLMYGLPNQSVEDAMHDLECAIRLVPPHLSWYQLTIEPKTEFARRPPTGLPDSDLAADIEAAGLEVLARHGYGRYEVSAFARDGQECRHNLNYWRFGDYMGVGAGAHGKFTVDGTIWRTVKSAQPRLYMRCPTETAVNEVATADLPGEFMMNALRLIDGVDIDAFTPATGLPVDVVRAVRTELVSWGLMHEDRLALTARGLQHLDAIVARFVEP